jgi:5,10-methylenetetrahydrofolate reductase
MTIRYEANPPKILPDIDTTESIQKFVKKIKIISKKCDAIHITENVLGFQRVSPIEVGKIIRKEIPNMPITVSLRVRDKTEQEISEFVDNCISIGFSGILILMGDPSQTGKVDSGQIPSLTVKRLRAQEIDSKIDLYLSVSNKPNFSKIGKKIEAKPKGFMTQAIQNISQVQDLSKNLKGFSIIPILLYPSPKNEKSAKFLNLDLELYGKGFEELLKKLLDLPPTGRFTLVSCSICGAANEYQCRR